MHSARGRPCGKRVKTLKPGCSCRRLRSILPERRFITCPKITVKRGEFFLRPESHHRSSVTWSTVAGTTRRAATGARESKARFGKVRSARHL